MKDLTGTQIGSLTVLRYEPHFEKVTKKSQQKVTEVWQGRWICRCVCGKEIPVLANRLLHKKTTSCGCQSKNKPGELTNKKFGKLLVLSRAENSSQGKTRWKCLCDCGKETVVAGDKLVAKLQISCGCSGT